VTLVEETLDAVFLEDVQPMLVGDKAYDSDPLDERLWEERGVELVAPHKVNRRRSATQDASTVATIPAAMESRAFVCLVAKLPPTCCAL